jgi:hypothetical protein
MQPESLRIVSGNQLKYWPIIQILAFLDGFQEQENL